MLGPNRKHLAVSEVGEIRARFSRRESKRAINANAGRQQYNHSAFGTDVESCRYCGDSRHERKQFPADD